ncbi:FMN-binding negative transcriptional regulator [Iodobacter sp. HSC-16F04]|uniref:FMN-binding negative transcriptional regulator n=1 Tax=Iodobacter violaceini TaxID=3044271 RepID=A0ABX0KRS1_9NEIS|nr:FMN-binding negative transcriptional regulator [Iodobacter violacea]NHQ87338.1 FMN-binding negative transcriptional regulator [Iodobacter violacea]
MYTPAAFAIKDTEILHQFIRDYGFATLVSQVDGKAFASHLPLTLIAEEQKLVGHIARANPHWQAWQNDAQVLGIFQVPHGYISHRYYPSGPQVPTWNYSAVHVQGSIKLLDNPAPALAALLAQYEGEPYARPDIMPAEFIQRLQAAIVGFEIKIESLIGKFKLTQDDPRAEQSRIIEALAQGSPADQELATFMQKHKPTF